MTFTYKRKYETVNVVDGVCDFNKTFVFIKTHYKIESHTHSSLIGTAI